MCSHEGEILVDVSKSGRERPWKTHKTNSSLLAESFSRLGQESKSENVCSCGSFLKFHACPAGHEQRLTWANFCRVRLCPMCSWRRSLLIAHQLKTVAHESVQRQPLRWLFLTLTVRNCEGDDLQDTLNHMMKSWDRFSKRKPFQNAVVGWFRSLEVTRKTEDGTYHPHFHVLLGVSPMYFKKKKHYLETKEWEQLWRQSLQVDYDPICHITAVKKKRNVEKEAEILAAKGVEISPDGDIIESQLPGSAVAELAKYSTKSNDYLVYNRYKQKQHGKKVKLIPDEKSGINEEETDKVVYVLDKSLARRRLTAYGGLLKEVWNDLQQKGQIDDAEDENADLVHVDSDKGCQCSVCGSNMLEELYTWLPNVKNYIKKD